MPAASRTPAPRRGGPPFASLRPAAATIAVYAVATVVWTLAGPVLPGGRWLAVHLFTLGVLSNAVVAFTRHFGATLSRQPGAPSLWQHVVLNAGIVALLTGTVVGATPVLAIGGTVVTAVVTANWWWLRTRRRRAVGARFDWVIRMYERTHGAFIHGAVLGVLLGTGVLGGGWYGSARLAHLHINLLGWGVLTLLATLVFFGPTVLRVQMEPGADARARRWLPVAATALTVAVVALLFTAVGGAWATVLRLTAALALGVHAAAAVVVCIPVLRVAHGAGASASGGLLRAACAWLPPVLAVDAVVVAAGQWRWLDAVGVVVLVGVLAQSVAGALGYVAPMFVRTDAAGRSRIREVLEHGPVLHPAVLNVGVGLLAVAALLGTAGGAVGAVAARVGWVVVTLFVTGRMVTVAVASRAAVRA